MPKIKPKIVAKKMPTRETKMVFKIPIANILKLVRGFLGIKLLWFLQKN